MDRGEWMARWLPRATIAGLLVALAWLTWDAGETTRLDRELRRIREAHEPITTLEYAALTWDASRTAAEAPVMARLRGPDAGRRYAAAALLVTGFDGDPAATRALSSVTASRAWTDEERAAVGMLVAAHGEAMALVQQARALPLSSTWIEGLSMTPPHGALMSLALLNGGRARLAIEQQRGGDAAEALLDQIGLLRVFEQDGRLLFFRLSSERQAIALVQQLRQASPASVTPALTAALARLPEVNWTERYVLARRVAHLDAGRLVASPRASASWSARLLQPLLRHELRRQLQIDERLLAAARAPLADRERAMQAVSSDVGRSWLLTAMRSSMRSLMPPLLVEGNVEMTLNIVRSERALREVRLALKAAMATRVAVAVPVS